MQQLDKRADIKIDIINRLLLKLDKQERKLQAMEQHNNTVHWTVQWTVHKLVDSPLSTGLSSGQ